MLFHLHVKNLALIDEADIEFGEGLNILTGETGAGKSILMGSVGMALGGKASRDMIRQGCDQASVELLFSVDSPEKEMALRALDVEPDGDGLVIITRKITPARSVSRINDETVTSAKLKQVTGLLIDIHGQHEHQSLLYHARHLEILDEYAKSTIRQLKENTASLYKEYAALKARLSGFTADEESRVRERDFLRFEIDEIEGAALRSDEEEELTAEYRRFVNGRKIAEALSMAHQAMNSDAIGTAVKEVEAAAGYDEGLSSIRDQLYDVDAIVGDVLREISVYMEDLSFDEARLHEVEERLDLIHGLQAKYGATVERIFVSLEEKREKLFELENYDERKAETEKELLAVTGRLEDACGKLTAARREAAGRLCTSIAAALRELNFLDVRFDMEFKALDHFTAGGADEAEFVISTNPGEPLKPLGQVASGGELSRIMLAIKTVLADTDDIPTLIFDEIDAGISGRTAQMVSEKLKVIAGSHQVICITHLPQIAAMADCHFEIVKSAEGGRTVTRIRRLDEEASVRELARLLGGAKITDAVMENAREMKRMAGRNFK